jgi:hypothetical protein
MIANDPNVTMAERMAFSRHSNPNSHIAYIRAGHNSDFAFQKAVSGAPMPKKKEILQKKAVVKKGAKTKKKPQKQASMPPNKTSRSKAKVIRKATPPTTLAYMKAPPTTVCSKKAKAVLCKSSRTPQKLAPHKKAAPPKKTATRLATRSTCVRRSVRVPKKKKLE